MNIRFDIAAAIFFLVLLFPELNSHNKKVEEEWPDYSDPRQNEMRRKFTISMMGHYFLLILLVLIFLKNLILG